MYFVFQNLILDLSVTNLVPKEIDGIWIVPFSYYHRFFPLFECVPGFTTVKHHTTIKRVFNLAFGT